MTCRLPWRMLALFCSLLALGSARALAAAEAPVIVVASIAPLAEFARAVGGERVRVETLAAPGQDPHQMELVPSQMVLLDRAGLLLLNGLGLEPYGPRLQSIAGGKGLRVLLVGEGLADPDEMHGRPVWKTGQPQPKDDGPYRLNFNPHVWLDPLLAVIQVARIRDALAEVRPEDGATFAAHAEGYIARLMALHASYVSALGGVRQRSFIAYHGAYVHLARRYGLTQIAVAAEGSEQEPSAARVAEVIKLARAMGATVIFAEPQFPSKATQTIAEEAGLRVDTLDPLGSGGASYMDFMHANLRALSAALQP